MTIFITLAAIALLVLAAVALDIRLAVPHYRLPAKPLTRPLRIIVLADHHSSPYGKAQMRLLALIRKQNPDLILMPGDMADDKRSNREVELLFRGLRDYGRPVYYTTGNHESRRGADMARVKAMAERYGITVLTDETKRIEI
ncbi:MAG: metallophosphoesterase, partial [Oscillospiraceae bacterium]|nr:metallophosphoesterase [Oscillospiraceae bacterium]